MKSTTPCNNTAGTYEIPVTNSQQWYDGWLWDTNRMYRKISNIWRTKLKCLSSRRAVVFGQSNGARSYVENEDVVRAAPTGDAPTTSEWSTILLPAKVSYIRDLTVIFSVVVCLMWLCHHMLPVSYVSRESWVLFPLLVCSPMMCTNNRVHYSPGDGRIRLFAHCTTSLWSLCRRICRYWTKCLSGTFCRVCI